MLVSVSLLIVGVALLYYGAEWLVSGSAGLARSFGVNPLVIGLTIVAYGTSAPELVVSLAAATSGSPDLALGNVVGSNIANIGLILGITAILAPPLVEPGIVRREAPFLLVATLAVPVVLLDGLISRTDGIVFTLGAVLFTVATLRWARQESAPREGASERAPDPRGRLALLCVVGLALLLGGGKVFVEGAIRLATLVGMSERIIGLTVVAVGTSLPELAASLVAAFRGHSELAVGNVIGSNVFNALLILGVTSIVHPIAGDLTAMRLDVSAMILLTVFAAYSMRKGRNIGRAEGVAYVTAYAGFVGALLVGG